MLEMKVSEFVKKRILDGTEILEKEDDQHYLLFKQISIRNEPEGIYISFKDKEGNTIVEVNQAIPVHTTIDTIGVDGRAAVKVDYT